VRHFVEIAKVVADSTNPKIVVPTSIYTLLCDVISLRREVSRILGEPVIRDDGQVDGHIYFINVLEQVKDILRPLAEKIGFKNALKPETSDQKLGNIFEALTLEEPSQLEPDSSVPVTEQQPNRNALLDHSYDIEPSLNEVLFASLLFFRDFNEIRERVRTVWVDYSQGRASLIMASLLTNTAFEIIRRNLEDQLSGAALQQDAPKENDWIAWVYSSSCNGIDLHYREHPVDPINFSTYQQADYFCLLTFDIIKTFMKDLRPDRLQFARNYDAYLQFVKSPRERYFSDKLFLTSFLSNLHNAAALKLDAGPAIDDITRAFLEAKVSETKHVPLWLVFALQIVLDTRVAFQYDTSKALKELLAAGQRVTDITRHHFRFSRTQAVREERWHEDNDPQILKLIRFISLWINQDLLTKAVKKWSTTNLQKLGAELKPFSLLRQHPLLCGSLAYWLNLSLQEIGISLANAYDSIVSAAHLYNAARQSKGLSVSWPDIEYLISVHSIFVGGPPSEPADFFKRFQIALGASLVNFAQHKRAARPRGTARKSGGRRLRKSVLVHEIFRSRYCSLDSRAELTNPKLSAVIVETATQHPEMRNVTAYATQWAQTRKLTSPQLLSILCVAITDEDPHLHFDYISMHIRCTTLLFDMRQKFITGADIQTPAVAGKKVEMPHSRYLAEVAMAEDSFAARVVTSIFLADTEAAAAAATTVDSEAPLQSEKLRDANISLKRASNLMGRVIKAEGDLCVTEAKAFCQRAESDHPNSES
jgi:hypothetical protein